MGRRFNDSEISSILKRASELQQQRTERSPATGLTLEEIQQIAAEAGIDPSIVREAVQDLGREPSGEKDGFNMLGAPSRFELERVFDGEMTKDEREALVPKIRDLFEFSGRFESFASSLNWTTENTDITSHQVTVQSEKGQTRVKVKSHLGGVVALMFLVPLILSFLIMLPVLITSVQLPGWIELLIGGGILGTQFLLTRMIFAGSARKQERQIERFFEHVESVLEERETLQPEPNRETASEPLISLDEDQPETLNAPVNQRRKTRS